MRLQKCPRCGRELDVTGSTPGAVLTCGACGGAVIVTEARPARGRRWPYVLLGSLALCGSCLGVSIRNNNRFVIRSMQGECKANLKLWYTTQRVTQQEKDLFAKSNAISGFAPERGNRYAYFSGPGPLEDRSHEKITGTEQAEGVGVDTYKYPNRAALTFQQLPKEVALHLGLSGTCPQCDITLACMGQIDVDETLDVWTISTAERKAPDGTPIPAGQPFNDVNDVER